MLLGTHIPSIGGDKLFDGKGGIWGHPFPSQFKAINNIEENS
jgi:hypothetical protein